MLTEPVKASFKDAARKLTGEKKRLFTAQVALDYFDGSARKTERALGWDRFSIQKGLDSLRSEFPIPTTIKPVAGERPGVCYRISSKIFATW